MLIDFIHSFAHIHSFTQSLCVRSFIHLFIHLSIGTLNLNDLARHLNCQLLTSLGITNIVVADNAGGQAEGDGLGGDQRNHL